MRQVIAWALRVFRRNATADEIREELEFHLDARTSEFERDGLPREAARRKAVRRVGNLARHEARGYRVRGGGMVDSVLQDLRYAVRGLLRRPGFSLIAVVTIALGIGASTAIVSVIDAAVLRPLPYPDPEQLVQIQVEEHLPNFGFRHGRDPSLDDRRLWTASSRTLSWVAARDDGPGVRRVVRGDVLERLADRQVSENYFELHGIAPVLGRTFNTADTATGAPAVAMVSYGYWQRRFGGRADVIGQALRYEDELVTIVGVVPQGFYDDAPVWRPLQVPEERATSRQSGKPTYARLRPAVTTEEAAAELTAMAAGRPDPPGVDSQPTVLVTRLLDKTPQTTRTTTAILASAVALILLIGCVNVAGLLLARGATRQSEMAIRASLGAGRTRLIRQLLTESLLLAAAGGVAGVALAWLSLGALVANIPMSLPPNAPATVNLTVLGYAAAVTIATGLIFGLLPAFRVSRASPGAAVTTQASRSDAPLPRRGGQLLIATEIALAVVLLAAGGLMLRSFGRVLAVDLGFDPSRFLTMEVMPVGEGTTMQASYYPSLVEAIGALPGVEAAGAIDFMPLGDSSITIWVYRPDGNGTGLSFRRIVPGYLDAVGLPILRGRTLLASDRSGETATAVILNEQGARDLFPDGPALGRTVLIGGEAGTPAEVVGIVADQRHRGPLSPPVGEIYLPFVEQADDWLRSVGLTVVIRPNGSSPVTAPMLREIAQGIGPPVVVEGIRGGRELYGERVVTPRQRTVLLSLLGGLGLVLALVGIFGMTAYAVARRTREIGVRVAFGARPGHVVGRMVGDAAWPIAIGMLVGLGVAAMATRVIESFLFETTPTDPLTFATVAVVLSTAGLLAAWIPARRAARVDPVLALRAE